MVRDTTMRLTGLKFRKVRDRVSNRPYPTFRAAPMGGPGYVYRSKPTCHDDKPKATLWHAVPHGVHSTGLVEISEIGQPFCKSGQWCTLPSLHARHVLHEDQLGLEVLNKPEEVQKQRPPIIILNINTPASVLF